MKYVQKISMLKGCFNATISRVASLVTVVDHGSSTDEGFFLLARVVQRPNLYSLKKQFPNFIDGVSQ